VSQVVALASEAVRARRRDPSRVVLANDADNGDVHSSMMPRRAASIEVMRTTANAVQTPATPANEWKGAM
jgi:hypothetical protein